MSNENTKKLLLEQNKSKNLQNMKEVLRKLFPKESNLEKFFDKFHEKRTVESNAEPFQYLKNIGAEISGYFSGYVSGQATGRIIDLLSKPKTVFDFIVKELIKRSVNKETRDYVKNKVKDFLNNSKENPSDKNNEHSQNKSNSKKDSEGEAIGGAANIENNRLPTGEELYHEALSDEQYEMIYGSQERKNSLYQSIKHEGEDLYISAILEAQNPEAYEIYKKMFSDSGNAEAMQAFRAGVKQSELRIVADAMKYAKKLANMHEQALLSLMRPRQQYDYMRAKKAGHPSGFYNDYLKYYYNSYLRKYKNNKGMNMELYMNNDHNLSPSIYQNMNIDPYMITNTNTSCDCINYDYINPLAGYHGGWTLTASMQ